MTTERTWKITDADGSNRRRVTLAEFRADMDARKAAAKPIMDAWMRGDKAGVLAAQAAMRSRRET